MSIVTRVPWRRLLSSNSNKGPALANSNMNTIDNDGGGNPPVATSIFPVSPSRVGALHSMLSPDMRKTELSFNIQQGTPDTECLKQAAKELREGDTPVAFPTETVYGLGADATRSSAVKGIFKAKQRPSDNPLIVHISSLQQLRNLLNPTRTGIRISNTIERVSKESLHDTPIDESADANACVDDIPEIYHPLIKRFWPGPLTLIMPNPRGSVLAPEVTAHLETFGVRMPSSTIALALIELAGVPLAAPSANASSKPSTTTAAHVKHDLNGRIATIIDGGACDLGVESTVVHGLVNPPLILRPGGISLDQLRSCPGWESVTEGYQNKAQTEAKPTAPGMKYKHYSPEAKVVLYEFTLSQPGVEDLAKHGKKIGLMRTNAWSAIPLHRKECASGEDAKRLGSNHEETATQSKFCCSLPDSQCNYAQKYKVEVSNSGEMLEVWDVDLGNNLDLVAQRLFSAFRLLDKNEVDAIIVEGIDSTLGGAASAIMNRVKKAATETKS